MKKMRPPRLSTAFSESGKSAKKRLGNILDTRAKRVGMAFIIVAAAAVVLAGAVFALGGEKHLAPEIESAVGEALLADGDRYADAEFWAEAHIILGSAKSRANGETKIYAVTSVGGYSFMNGMFIKNSGSGAIPAVITVAADGDTDVEYPKDGSYYASSLREMFPVTLLPALFMGDYYPELEVQEREQAREYLKSIGREAEVGNPGDLDRVFPDISAAASNAVDAYRKDNAVDVYPYFIGNTERLEDGKRYIYATLWDGADGVGKLTLRKTGEDGFTWEEYNFAIDGDSVVPMPSVEVVEIPMRMIYDDPLEGRHIDLEAGRRVLDAEDAETVLGFRAYSGTEKPTVVGGEAE